MDTFTQPEHASFLLAEETQMSLEATELADNLLDLIANCETRLQNLRPGLNPDIILEQRHGSSEPDTSHKCLYEHIEIISHAKSEGAIPSSEDCIPPEENIAQWSLQLLKDSAVEKLQYLNYLQPRLKRKDALEGGFEHWRSLITHSWANSHMDWPRSPDSDIADGSCPSEHELKLEAELSQKLERDEHGVIRRLYPSFTQSTIDAKPRCQQAIRPVASSNLKDYSFDMDAVADLRSERHRSETKQNSANLLPGSTSSSPCTNGQITVEREFPEKTTKTGFQGTSHPPTGTHLHINNDTVVVSRRETGRTADIPGDVIIDEGFILVPYFARLVHDTLRYISRTPSSQPPTHEIPSSSKSMYSLSLPPPRHYMRKS
jgi:hypothetical protein